jgi:RNA polymerase sigma-70 factor (ECF subfamily)
MIRTDTELINNAISGNMASFEELVYRYDKQVLSIALKYSNNEDDAKDIYQEVFIRVFKGLKNFKFKSEFSTWLFRVATNVCLTYRMKVKKYQHVSIDEGFDDENEKDFNVHAAGMEESPERSFINSEISGNIKVALEALNPNQKMIFVLKHLEGYKLREIAVMMDVGEGTVKKYLFDAVHKLRKELQKIYG